LSVDLRSLVNGYWRTVSWLQLVGAAGYEILYEQHAFLYMSVPRATLLSHDPAYIYFLTMHEGSDSTYSCTSIEDSVATLKNEYMSKSHESSIIAILPYLLATSSLKRQMRLAISLGQAVKQSNVS